MDVYVKEKMLRISILCTSYVSAILTNWLYIVNQYHLIKKIILLLVHRVEGIGGCWTLDNTD